MAGVASVVGIAAGTGSAINSIVGGSGAASQAANNIAGAGNVGEGYLFGANSGATATNPPASAGWPSIAGIGAGELSYLNTATGPYANMGQNALQTSYNSMLGPSANMLNNINPSLSQAYGGYGSMLSALQGNSPNSYNANATNPNIANNTNSLQTAYSGLMANAGAQTQQSTATPATTTTNPNSTSIAGTNNNYNPATPNNPMPGGTNTGINPTSGLPYVNGYDPNPEIAVQLRPSQTANNGAVASGNQTSTTPSTPQNRFGLGPQISGGQANPNLQPQGASFPSNPGGGLPQQSTGTTTPSMGLGPQIMSQSNSMGLGPQVSPSGYNPYQGQTTQPQGAYNPANIASNANAGLAGMMSTNSPLYSQLMGLTGTTTQSANQQWNALGQQGNQTMNTANAALGQAQQNMGNYNALQSQNMSSLQNAMQTANTATQYANMSNMASNPAYQFELQQGQNAIQNSAAANGGFFSGQTGTALANYSEGLAATYAPQLASQMQSLAENPLQNQLTAQSGLQGLQTNALSPYTQLLGAQGTVQGQQYNTLNPVSQMTGLSQGVQGNTLGENQTVTNSLQSGQTNQNNNLTNLFNSASPYITGGISGTSQGLTNLQSILQALSSQGAGIPANTASLAAGYSTMAPAYTSAGLNSLGNTAMGTANLINQGSYTYDTGVSDSDAQNALLYSQQQQTNPTAMSFINSIL